MSYQDPYQPGYGQQPGYDPAAYPQQPYSGGPSYPTTPAPNYPAAYPQGGYVQPAYVAPPNASTNTMAILALVFAFVFAPLAIVFGHIAKKQIRERGEQGEGLATAGLVCGYIFTGLWLVGCVFYILVIVIAIGAGSTTSNDYDYVIRTAADLVQALR
jgi:hypothetical protein